MKYDVTLKIAYDYPSAVAVARHTLRVRPRSPAGQTIETTTVKIAPSPDERVGDLDFYGNPLDEIALTRPHERLRIEMRARVDLLPLVPDLAATPSLASVADAALRSRDASGLSPIHFLGRFAPHRTAARRHRLHERRAARRSGAERYRSGDRRRQRFGR